MRVFDNVFTCDQRGAALKITIFSFGWLTPQLMNMEKISSSLVMHLKCITLLGDHDENDLLLNIGSAKIFDVMKNEVNQ